MSSTSGDKFGSTPSAGSALEPYGRALMAYYAGESGASFIIRRDDGFESGVPSAYFFRDEKDFSRIEQKAVSLCKGLVLDVGAGAGSISLVLQRGGYRVTALDICPEAADLMRRRGIDDVNCADIFSFVHERFDTVLMLGHGIGMVETREGLHRYLDHARTLLNTQGQILVDSLDVRRTDDPKHLAYHQARRHEGRYIGEIRMQFEYQNVTGPYCGWLQVDPDTLQKEAEWKGWQFEMVCQEDHGDYLARLIKM